MNCHLVERQGLYVNVIGSTLWASICNGNDYWLGRTASTLQDQDVTHSESLHAIRFAELCSPRARIWAICWGRQKTRSAWWTSLALTKILFVSLEDQVYEVHGFIRRCSYVNIKLNILTANSPPLFKHWISKHCPQPSDGPAMANWLAGDSAATVQ